MKPKKQYEPLIVFMAPWNREIPHQRDTRLIIIAAEGEITEKQYFESELFYNHRV